MGENKQQECDGIRISLYHNTSGKMSQYHIYCDILNKNQNNKGLGKNEVRRQYVQNKCSRY